MQAISIFNSSPSLLTVCISHEPRSILFYKQIFFSLDNRSVCYLFVLNFSYPILIFFKLPFTDPTEMPAEHIATPHLFSQDDCLPGFQHYRDACYMALQTQSNRSFLQLHDNLSATCAATVPIPLSCNATRGLSGCPVVMTPHSQAEAAVMRLLAFSKQKTSLPGAEVWTGIKILYQDRLVSANAAFCIGNASAE